MNTWDLPHTLGALRRDARYTEERLAHRSVKDELRANLIARLRSREPLFPGVYGYEDTVTPQIVNALLSRHNFILLGLRGQAKTKLIRVLTTLLDPAIPYVAGSEVRDNPYAPVSRYAKNLIEDHGEETPIAWLTPEQRYVEKLATPDVTVADMIGDIDPIKAARQGVNLADELTIHYGLLPRANRSIFAINELPDLAGRIQVSLFNIMQEGDVQIKGYPVRLPLDVLLVFTANPEDYTARGKIITPLKDRIGSEIRTHYPLTLDHGVAITMQEAWSARAEAGEVHLPPYMAQLVEQIAFVAREDRRVDKRSGVSQRMAITTLENVISNAERRALVNNEATIVPRVSDVYAALPAITGKMELEYEGELKGGDAVAREIIRNAIGRVFKSYMEDANLGPAVKWFDRGGSVKLDETMDSAALLDQLQQVEGLLEKVKHLGLGSNEPDALRASAGEFILEGLYALRRISRDEEVGFRGEARGENRGESRGEGRAAPLEDEAAEIDPLEIRRKRDRRKFN
ncbi:MAG: magnesium chelatase [Bryobacterales bacterium]|jgi:magnesium chelatase subunit I|nr:magnesium chelatase [Bryobacterales bacterium]